MTAVADQSTISNEPQVWAALAIVGALAFLVWAHRVARAARRQRAAQRRHDARTVKPRPCHTTGCAYPAPYMVMRPAGPGRVEVLDVCAGCRDEGIAFGWWLPFAQDVTA